MPEEQVVLEEEPKAPEEKRPEAPPAKAGKGLKEDQILGIIAYIGVLCLVPLLMKKSKFSLFHAKQGLVLFIIEMAAYILFYWLFWALYPIYYLAGLFCGVLSIIGIINAYQEKMQELPLIGQVARKFKF